MILNESFSNNDNHSSVVSANKTKTKKRSKETKESLAAVKATTVSTTDNNTTAASAGGNRIKTASMEATTVTDVEATQQHQQSDKKMRTIAENNSYQSFLDKALKDKDEPDGRKKGFRKRVLNYSVLFHHYRRKAIASLNSKANQLQLQQQQQQQQSQDQKQQKRQQNGHSRKRKAAVSVALTAYDQSDNESNIDDGEQQQQQSQARNNKFRTYRTDQQINERNKAMRAQIPKDILKSTTLSIRVGAAIILLSEYKRGFMMKALNLISTSEEELSTVDEVLAFSELPVEEINAKLSKKQDSDESFEDYKNFIIVILMKLSDIVKERCFSAFLADYDYEKYLQVAKELVDRDLNNAHNALKLTTLYPYDALVKRYMRKCVAPYMQQCHNKEIMTQFKINPIQVMSRIIQDLIKMNDMMREKREAKLRASTANGGAGESKRKNGKIKDNREDNDAASDNENDDDDNDDGSSTTAKRRQSKQNGLKKRRKIQSQQLQFDEDIVYEVFKGPTNFHLKIIPKYVEHNGDTYEIREYKDCLYDVLSSKNQGSFNHLSWSNRLKLLDHKTRVMLTPMNGKTLNKFRPENNCLLGVSWLNDRGQSFYQNLAISTTKWKRQLKLQQIQQEYQQQQQKEQEQQQDDDNDDDNDLTTTTSTQEVDNEDED